MVKAIFPCSQRRRRAECVQGEMACPPEDSGGVSGYQALCQAMAAGTGPEAERFRGVFDAKAFDLQAVRTRLARLPV